MRRPRLSAKLVLAVLEVGAFVVLGFVVARSVTRPDLAWDLWSYHLPFAARLHGLGGGADGFLLSPVVAALWEGYPKAWNWVQGALWRATGDLRWIGLTASLPFVAWALHAARLLAIPRTGLVFGALAVPLVAIHVSVPYVDLPLAALLAIAALAAARLLADGDPEVPAECRGRREVPAECRESEVPAAWRRRDGVDAATFVGALALAGNSKYTAATFALPLAALLAVRALARARGPRRRRLVAVAIAAGLLAGGTPIRNAIVFGHPLHPLRAGLPGLLEVPADPRAVEVPADSPDYLPALGRAARPLYLILSVTELDWLVRGVEPGYDLGSTNGDRPARFGPARTGGWWGPYAVALALFVLWARRRAARRGASDRLADELGLQLALLVVVQAVVPHGHSLRFWMAVPLLLVALAARRAAWLDPPRLGRGFPALTAAAAAVALALLPTTANLSPWPVWAYDRERWRVELSDPRILEAIDRGESFCLGARHYPYQFRASRALVGGTHVVEQVRPGRECRVLPELDVPRGALHFWGLRQRPATNP